MLGKLLTNAINITIKSTPFKLNRIRPRAKSFKAFCHNLCFDWTYAESAVNCAKSDYVRLDLGAAFTALHFPLILRMGPII